MAFEDPQTLAIVGKPQETVAANIEGTKASYRATYNVSPTVFGNVLQIQGSASKTVRITRIAVGGVITTAATIDAVLYRASTAASGGSPVTSAAQLGGISKNDSASPAPTATLTAWSTPPSGVGTLTGGVGQQKMFCSTPTTQRRWWV